MMIFLNAVISVCICLILFQARTVRKAQMQAVLLLILAGAMAGLAALGIRGAQAQAVFSEPLHLGESCE